MCSAFFYILLYGKSVVVTTSIIQLKKAVYNGNYGISAGVKVMVRPLHFANISYLFIYLFFIQSMSAVLFSFVGVHDLTYVGLR